jgi:hypothetical protein
MAKTEREAAIRTLAKAHTSLCLFEAAVKLLEGSDVDARYASCVNQIVALCKDAEALCLRDYDRAVAVAKR